MTTAQPSAIPALKLQRADAAVAGLLLLAAIGLYGSLVPGYFLSDDFVILGWTHVDSAAAVLGLFDPRAPWFYRPLLKLVYWALQAAFGPNPVPFHLFTIGMHTLAAWLLYRLIVAVAGAGRVVALAATLLFYVNYRHAEPVASISAMGELIAVPLLLGALFAAHRFAATGRLLTALASTSLLAGALLGRESPVVLPALAALGISLFVHGRLRRRRLVLLEAGYLAVLAGYALLQVQVIDRGGESSGVLARGGLRFKALNLESLVLGLMDYVNGLVPGGQRLAVLPLEALRPVAWAELALLGVLAAGLAWRRWRLELFGLGWMLVSPLPFVFFNAPTDRYFYMPTIGYSLLLAGLLARAAVGLARVLRRSPRVLVPAALGGAIVVLLAPQVPALLAQEARWNAAAVMSAAVLADTRAAVPVPVRHQAFIYVNLPTEWEGVPVFRNGLQEAVQLQYGRDPTLRAGIMTCPQVREAHPIAPDSIFQFMAPGVRLLPDADACH